MAFPKRLLATALLAASSLNPLAAQSAPAPDKLVAIVKVDAERYNNGTKHGTDPRREVLAALSANNGIRLSYGNAKELGTFSTKLKSGEQVVVFNEDSDRKWGYPTSLNSAAMADIARDYIVDSDEVKAHNPINITYSVDARQNGSLFKADAYRAHVNVTLDGVTQSGVQSGSAPSQTGATKGNAAAKGKQTSPAKTVARNNTKGTSNPTASCATGSGCLSGAQKVIDLSKFHLGEAVAHLYTDNKETSKKSLRIEDSRASADRHATDNSRAYVVNLSPNQKVEFEFKKGTVDEVRYRIVPRGDDFAKYPQLEKILDWTRGDSTISFDEIPTELQNTNLLIEVRGYKNVNGTATLCASYLLNAVPGRTGTAPNSRTQDSAVTMLRTSPVTEIVTPTPTGTPSATFKIVEHFDNKNGGKAKPGDVQYIIEGQEFQAGKPITRQPGMVDIKLSKMLENYTTAFSNACTTVNNTTGRIVLDDKDDKTCEVTHVYVPAVAAAADSAADNRSYADLQILGQTGQLNILSQSIPFSFTTSGFAGKFQLYNKNTTGWVSLSTTKGHDAGSMPTGSYNRFFADRIDATNVQLGVRGKILKSDKIKTALTLGALGEFERSKIWNLPNGEVSNYTTIKPAGELLLTVGDFNKSFVNIGARGGVQLISWKAQGNGVPYNASNYKEAFGAAVIDGRVRKGRFLVDFGASYMPYVKTLSSTDGVHLGGKPNAFTGYGYGGIEILRPKNSGIGVMLYGGPRYADNKQTLIGPSIPGGQDAGSTNHTQFRYGINITFGNPSRK